MHSDEMSLQVGNFLHEAEKLQWKKNRDYHPDRVAFLEILRSAFECGMTVEQDLWAKIRKQYVALRSFVLEGKVESEPPRSRMIDIAVYMGMFAVWVDYKKQIVIEAYEFQRSDTKCETGSDLQFYCQGSGPVCDRCLFMEWLKKQSIEIR